MTTDAVVGTVGPRAASRRPASTVRRRPARRSRVVALVAGVGATAGLAAAMAGGVTQTAEAAAEVPPLSPTPTRAVASTRVVLLPVPGPTERVEPATPAPVPVTVPATIVVRSRGSR